MRRRDFITLLWRRGDVCPRPPARRSPFRPGRSGSSCRIPAGGGTDIVGRVLGQKLHESLGQPVVIDNRGGAGGTLGTAVAAKAAPDGYTLVLVPTSHVINPSIYAKLPYDTEKDFAPITMVASAAILMAVQSERARRHDARLRRGRQGQPAGDRQLRLGRCRHRVPPDRRAVQAADRPGAAARALSRRRARP